MRIGIDARKEWDGGIGRYIRNLLQGLHAEDSIALMHLWVKPESERLNWWTERLIPHVEGAGLYSLWEQVSLGRKVRKVDVDLFHSPHYVAPFFLRVPLVVTIHDIIHLIFPRSPLHRAYARRQIGYAARKARILIMPSEFSRREVIRYFPEAEGKSVSILHGLEPFFSVGPTANDAEIQRTLSLPETFLFYVGNHKPHKNISQLLEISREVFKDFPDLFLCLTGNREDENEAVYRAARRYGVEDRVRFLGTLNNEALRACYRKARVFVFPSLYEGFGFPPLEAMACGVPVLAFRVASLPEVMEEGGILVDRGDGRAFYQALVTLLTDEEAWHSWREKGLRQARKFRWDRAIHAHLKAYRSALRDLPV